MMIITAIDPGNIKSALIQWDGERILNAEIMENGDLLSTLKTMMPGHLVIEKIESYGMPVGATIFETVFWSGMFAQAWPGQWDLLPRREVKLYLCGSPRAKDGNIRQALIDRFGPIPTKKNPNWTYGGTKISKDLWAAWALAVTWMEKK